MLDSSRREVLVSAFINTVPDFATGAAVAIVARLTGIEALEEAEESDGDASAEGDDETSAEADEEGDERASSDADDAGEANDAGAAGD